MDARRAIRLFRRHRNGGTAIAFRPNRAGLIPLHGGRRNTLDKLYPALRTRCAPIEIAGNFIGHFDLYAGHRNPPIGLIIAEIAAVKSETGCDPFCPNTVVCPRFRSNPVIGCGWIKRGAEHPIQSNTGRQRLNINGAINIEALSAEIRFDDTIDADSTIALFQQIEQAYPLAPRIVVVCDNARYYRSKAVTGYLETSRIELEFLPPYAPNLNLIERFWKFFKREVLYNKYYETFGSYKAACKKFFTELDSFASRLRMLLTEKFQIIGKEKPKIAIA